MEKKRFLNLGYRLSPNKVPGKKSPELKKTFHWNYNQM